jgi:hypothetical protein
LTAERIYAYLDGEMDGAEARALKQHVAGCAACNAALEARRRIAEAAGSLPPFEVPDGFAAAVMARVGAEAVAMRPSRRRGRGRSLWRVRAWWAAAASGLALTAGAGWILISGRNLSGFAVDASRFLWGSIQGLATLAAKSFSYAALAVKVLGKLAGHVLEGLRVLSSFIGPEVQIACLGAALVLAAAGFTLWRRKTGMESHHEKP